MQSTRTILCSTALATLLAGTAMAQNVEDTVQEPGPTPGDMTAETAAETETVMSADAEPIGTVKSVQKLENGQTAVLIVLDDSLGLPVDQVRVAAEADPGGDYALAMSRAEFIGAVKAQLQAQGG